MGHHPRGRTQRRQHGDGVAWRRHATQTPRGDGAPDRRRARAGHAGQGRGDGTLQHGLDRDPAAAAGRRRLAGITDRRPGAARGRAHRHVARLAGALRHAVNEQSPWRPSASLDTLRRRAQALADTREFFRQRNVLEVETPAMINAPVSDVNIGSVRAEVPGRSAAPLFLHTSPEYAMKRLLAAGSGDIYQLCRVFRGAERGRQHNPEFTMVEWYRLGFSLDQLMREVADLVRLLLGRDLPVEILTYREAVRRHAGLDPLDAEA